MNKACHFAENQQVLLPIICFHGKIRILENLSFTAGLTASQKLKDISHEIDGGIEECNFFFDIL